MSSGSSLPLGRYHRASHLGEGTYGSVVTVYNDDGEEFALKLFLDDDDSDDDDSECCLKPIDLGALREISCLRLLRGDNRHENITELQDVQADWGEEDEAAGAGTAGCLGMALPLGKHGSLADAIAKGTWYPSKKAKVQLAHGLLKAVCFLHDNGILHRDIKSNNVLLEQQEETNNNNEVSWKAILIDFSLAKPIDLTMWNNKHPASSSSATTTTMEEREIILQHTGEVGTVVYTAPEIVAQQESYGKPSDLYSVGVVLLELLTQQLFSATKAREGVTQIQQALDRLPKTAPFADLLRQLLKTDPSERLTARQALEHGLFAKFGLEGNDNDIPEGQRRIVNVATALPYDDDTDDDDAVQVEENKPPSNNNKAQSKGKKKKRLDKKLQKRLQRIDKILYALLDGDSPNSNTTNNKNPWTRSAALEYSQQLEQLDDTIDDDDGGSPSQALIDCCVLAHRFFELQVPDLQELDESTTTGPFANWSLEDYVDNEATIFMLLDYCLYPRKLLL